MQVPSSDEGWNVWYDAEGAADISARKDVYRAGLPDGVELFQLEEKTLELATLLGNCSLNTVVDVGCSDASWLHKLQQRGHEGLLIGIEPNAGQFGKEYYWEPEDGEVLDVSNGGPTNRLLIKSNAQAIPLADRTSDVTLMQLAMYHVPKPDQPMAIEELKRITKDSGAVIITTRGENNKQTMNEMRQSVARYLARLMGEEIIPPANVNNDFTTENGRDLLPRHFSHVYESTHHADLVFDTPDKFSVIENAQATFRGLYKTKYGEPLMFPWGTPIDEFYKKRYELAFAQSEMGHMLDISEQPITDTQEDAIFVCSNEPQAPLADLGYRPVA